MNPSIIEDFRIELFGGPRLLRGSARIALSPQQAAFLGLVFGQETASVSRKEAMSRFGLTWRRRKPDDG